MTPITSCHYISFGHSYATLYAASLRLHTAMAAIDAMPLALRHTLLAIHYTSLILMPLLLPSSHYHYFLSLISYFSLLSLIAIISYSLRHFILRHYAAFIWYCYYCHYASIAFTCHCCHYYFHFLRYYSWCFLRHWLHVDVIISLIRH